jgi:hypothetical protein
MTTRRWKRTVRSAVIVGSIACTLLSGCLWPRSFARVRGADGVDTVLTTADVRALVSVPHNEGKYKPGHVTPKRIICAEPSPDVVKAVSESFGAGGGIQVHIPPGTTNPEIAAAASGAATKAYSESVAQLTQRMATIQLLRDGLYRACEAYANGAMTETTYAILLSRYDDTMITLLLGELAAGNFGGQLAAIGTSASASAGASAALDKLLQQQVAATKAESKVDAAEEAKAAEENKNSGDTAGAEKSVKAANDEHAKTVEAVATAKAEVKQLLAATGSAAQPSAELAKVLEEMQRKYLENINFDALFVACVVAMSEGGSPPLADFCKETIPKVMALNGRFLEQRVERATKEEEWAGVEGATKKLSTSLDRIDELKKKLNAAAPKQ